MLRHRISSPATIVKRTAPRRQRAEPRNAYALANSLSRKAREAGSSTTARAFKTEQGAMLVIAAPEGNDLARAVTYAQRYAAEHGIALESAVFMIVKS